MRPRVGTEDAWRNICGRPLFIVAARLPVFDFDDDGYTALGHVLIYLVENNGAMIQADGEGFYEGGKVIVVLD
ncbi:hypothetical protein M1D88_11770 [Arthrobacter sp. R1-13]